MSNPNNEKYSFYNLLEAEVRLPKFMQAVKEIAGSKITPDIAVDTVFLLIDSIDELNEWVAETNKFPNKYTRYTEFKHQAKTILKTFKCFMSFGKDLNLTRHSIKMLRAELRSYFMSLDKSIESKSFRF